MGFNNLSGCLFLLDHYKQLHRLATEITDLESDDGSITLADLTLDEFRQDLHQFLDQQRATLETAPLGLFAVVPVDAQILQAQAGTLFCLREKIKPKPHADTQAQDQSSLNPLAYDAQNYYLLYVREGGEVRLTHMQAKAVLNLWRALSVGKAKAYSDLCRAFDRCTHNGQDMSASTALLQAAVASIAHTSHGAAVQKLTSQREFILQPKLERLGQDTSFELITWLVIQPAANHP